MGTSNCQGDAGGLAYNAPLSCSEGVADTPFCSASWE